MPYGRGVRGFFAFKLTKSDYEESISSIQDNYNKFFRNAFEFYFQDDYYNNQYKRDLIVGKVFGTFSFLAIFVTILGVLGLFSFMIIQRTKEISIRNILDEIEISVKAIQVPVYISKMIKQDQHVTPAFI